MCRSVNYCTEDQGLMASKMTRQRVTHVVILNMHKARTGALLLNDANEFVSRNGNHYLDVGLSSPSICITN